MRSSRYGYQSLEDVAQPSTSRSRDHQSIVPQMTIDRKYSRPRIQPEDIRGEQRAVNDRQLIGIAVALTATRDSSLSSDFSDHPIHTDSTRRIVKDIHSSADEANSFKVLPHANPKAPKVTVRTHCIGKRTSDAVLRSLCRANPKNPSIMHVVLPLTIFRQGPFTAYRQQLALLCFPVMWRM